MKKDLIIETGMCFLRVGKPVVDGFIKASGSSVVLFSVPFDGYVLVSLDVNGTAVARRELFKMVEGSIAVGDYTVAYANDAVTISTTENNDLVHIRIEPVEVVVSDAFRAAVKKDAPKTPDELPAVGADDKGKFLHANESTGALEWAEGGTVVHAVSNENTLTLDKTWQEIFDGDYTSVSAMTVGSSKILGKIVQVANEATSYYVDVELGSDDNLVSFSTDSASGYPSATME